MQFQILGKLDGVEHNIVMSFRGEILVDKKKRNYISLLHTKRLINTLSVFIILYIYLLDEKLSLREIKKSNWFRLVLRFKPISHWWQNSFLFHCVTLAYLTRKGYFAKEMSISMSGQRLKSWTNPNVSYRSSNPWKFSTGNSLWTSDFSHFIDYFISNSIALVRYTKPTLNYLWPPEDKRSKRSMGHCNLQLLENTHFSF